MSSSKNNDWENWTVEKGDYHRGYHSTSRFEKQIRKRKTIKNLIMISFDLLLIGIISFILFTK